MRARVGVAVELLEVFAGKIVVGVEAEGAPVVHAGFEQAAGGGEGAAEVGFGVGVIGMEADGGPEMDQGPGEVALRGEGVADSSA